MGKITRNVHSKVQEFHFKGQSMVKLMVNFCFEVSFLKVTTISFECSFLNPVFALWLLGIFLNKQSMQSSGLCPTVFRLKVWSFRKDFFSVIKPGSLEMLYLLPDVSDTSQNLK